jgi:hypothetical protein
LPATQIALACQHKSVSATLKISGWRRDIARRDHLSSSATETRVRCQAKSPSRIWKKGRHSPPSFLGKPRRRIEDRDKPLICGPARGRLKGNGCFN